MSKKYAIGADIGGSHISTMLVDMETGAMISSSHEEQKIDNQSSAGEIIKNWSVAIQKTLNHIKDGKLIGIGFAMPGPFDYEKGVCLMKNVEKYDRLYGINVGDELNKILKLPKSIPFRYLNDALSFAVGECWIGKASGFKNVMAITLGTGFGSAFLTSGVPVIEGERVPLKGYVYHIPYKDGIADDYFSTRWLINEYAKQTGLICKGVKEIAERAEYEIVARMLFENFGTDIGNFLTPLLRAFDANSLVIGGNISKAYPLFGSSFEKALKDHNINIKIVISDMMESAAMVGSARLLNDDFWNKMEPLISKI